MTPQHLIRFFGVILAFVVGVTIIAVEPSFVGWVIGCIATVYIAYLVATTEVND